MSLKLGLALTMHLGTSGDFNGVHPFIEYEYNQYSLGVYYNSESAPSAYLSYTFEYDQFFLEVGGVTGYKASPVLPYGRVGYSFNDNTSVFVAPSAVVYEDKTEVNVLVGVEFSF